MRLPDVYTMISDVCMTLPDVIWRCQMSYDAAICLYDAAGCQNDAAKPHFWRQPGYLDARLSARMDHLIVRGRGGGRIGDASPPPFYPAPRGNKIDGEWGSLIGFRGPHRNPLVMKDLEERRESTDTSDGIISDVSLWAMRRPKPQWSTSLRRRRKS